MTGAASHIVHIARDGGVLKFVTALVDGSRIESVIVPMREREAGGARLRHTLCLSSQVGCRMGCAFCATARMGLVRNLTADEILGQVNAARELGRAPDNLVFMGMGEPLDNYDNLAAAIRALVDSRSRDGRPAEAFAASQIIVSTCGLVPGLERLATIGLNKLVLAVSINAPDDELRSSLMPVNRRHPLAELREALMRFPLRRRVFLAEYVLFKGVNDSRDHARALAAYLEPFRACVNVIPYNRPDSGADFEAPTIEEAERFKRWLNDEGQYARRRESKGGAISAGCGQLVTESPSPCALRP